MRIIVSLLLLVAAHGFSPVAPSRAASSTTTSLNAMNRREAVFAGLAAGVASIATAQPAFASTAADTLPNGVTYKVDKSGNGPQATRGELCAIRFKASTQEGRVIDDIFDTPEPYYTRVGLGGMLPGVEGALPYMKVGDRWTLTIPVRTILNLMNIFSVLLL